MYWSLILLCYNHLQVTQLATQRDMGVAQVIHVRQDHSEVRSARFQDEIVVGFQSSSVVSSPRDQGGSPRMFARHPYRKGAIY